MNWKDWITLIALVGLVYVAYCFIVAKDETDVFEPGQGDDE